MNNEDPKPSDIVNSKYITRSMYVRKTLRESNKLLRGQKLAFMKEIIIDEDKLAHYLLRLTTPTDNFIKRFPYDYQYYMDCIKEEENND